MSPLLSSSPAFSLASALALAAGLVVGALLAAVHLWASRRAATAALGRASLRQALLGFPVRVLGPALVLFGLALASTWALAGGLVAFLTCQRLLLARDDA